MRKINLCFCFLLVCSVSSLAQNAARITGVGLLEPSPGERLMQVMVQQGAVLTDIPASRATNAWIVMDGAAVAFASDSGVGGFENEGQSLHLYRASTGRTRKVLAEYYIIDSAWSVHLTNKKWALLVTMSDGGLGAERFAVVDPARGEVFFRNLCRVRNVAGDFVTLDFYTPEDWGLLVEGSEKESKGLKPAKTERVNLKTALAGKVIVNKRDPAY